MTISDLICYLLLSFFRFLPVENIVVTLVNIDMIWTFRNSTTVLIIFMTISNLIFTAIVLPLNSIAIMWPQWVFDFFTQFVLPEVFWSVSSNGRYIQDRPFCCASFAFLFYWSFATLLFMEAALAVNRWAAVCTHNLRFSFCRLSLLWCRLTCGMRYRRWYHHEIIR